MDKNIMVITPIPTPSKIIYEYNIKAFYEDSITNYLKNINLAYFLTDMNEHIKLAEKFTYIIKWEDSYEKGKINEELGNAATTLYTALEERGLDVIYEYE